MSAQPHEDWKQGLTPVGPQATGRPGPFYCYNPGLPKTGLLAADISVDCVPHGQITAIKDHYKLYDRDVANGLGAGLFKRQVAGATEIVAPVMIPGADNRRYLLEMYREEGLAFIDAFEGLDEATVQPRLFDQLIRPVAIWPHTLDEMDEEQAAVLRSRVEREGAIALLVEMAEAARETVRRREFTDKYGAQLARLYAAAIPVAVESLGQFRRFANRYIDRADALIRKQQNGGQGKAEYDPRDRWYQWMTGRKGIDDALTRALQPQAGLTADAVRALVEGLAGAPPQTAPAQVQCQTCGTFVNLLAGGRPPKICLGCREPLAEPPRNAPAKGEAKGQRMNRDKPMED